MFFFVGPTGVANINLGGAGIPPTLGANLPPVDPNAFGGTIHFGQPVERFGELPPGVNFNNQYSGYGGGYY